MKIKEAIKLNHLGQFVRDDEPEEKYGVYINGKLHNAYWGERPAKNVADYMQRLHPEKTITVKAMFGEEIEMDEEEVTEVTPELQPGSKIRTKKHSVEGEVDKIENGVVFFKLPDGRMMKTSEKNVVPVEKLEDEGFEEGTMGGINRCAPSNDVSYEKVLDEVMDKYMQTHSDHQGAERRADPAPQPISGLNREKAQKIANAMNIRLNDTIYVYKLVKGMITLDDVPSAVRMAIYNLFGVENGSPITPEGTLKPYISNKLQQIVAEHKIAEEVKRLSQLFNESDPCWDGYKQIGMKKKGGKKVPNCVPKK